VSVVKVFKTTCSGRAWWIVASEGVFLV